MSILRFDQRPAREAALQALRDYRRSFKTTPVTDRHLLHAQLHDAWMAVLRPVFGRATEAYVQQLEQLLKISSDHAQRSLDKIEEQRERKWMFGILVAVLFIPRFLLELAKLGLPPRLR